MRRRCEELTAQAIALASLLVCGRPALGGTSAPEPVVAREPVAPSVDRAELVREIGSALAPFRALRPSARDWPALVRCARCGDLQEAARSLASIAERWPHERPAQRERLLAELCAAARPAAAARAELESRFRYYTWTADGARLVSAATFFARPALASGCRDQ